MSRATRTHGKSDALRRARVIAPTVEALPRLAREPRAPRCDECPVVAHCARRGVGG